MRPAGTSTSNASVMRVRGRVRSMSMALIYFATASAVANLANSDGWNLKAPKSIHDWPPLVTVPINNVATSSTSTIP